MSKHISHEVFEELGNEMYALVTRLYPICRSITGPGVRQTLSILQELIPLDIYDVPTGTEIFDWTVPEEWTIRDAYIKDSQGRRIVDFGVNNLHVLNYSTPIKGIFSLEELRPHLFTLPDQPDLIPYRTSYYQKNWGFCLSQHQYEAMQDEAYDICIDSILESGSLTYGEYFLPGDTEEEVLISTHVCHPSLANDNLSAISVCTYLAKYLSQQHNWYSYRFIFIPATIGAITWLAMNENKVERIRHGLVASLLGDSGPFTYKTSRQGSAEIDRVVGHVLKQSDCDYQITAFSPYGYDERQFCSPGFNLAVGNLTRTPFAQYSEYHTSADNLDFVKSIHLAQSYQMYRTVLDVLDRNDTLRNLKPKCEPQLGKRGLYDLIGGSNDRKTSQLALLWVLNLSDGAHSLLDIAERADLCFDLIRESADTLIEAGLLAT